MNFSQQCYEKIKTVPKGQVTTYKELAHALGTKAYRAVGTAMNKNPHAPLVPCHRVINSDGNVGGFAHGAQAKIDLLRKEGIDIVNNKVQQLQKVLFTF